jgi:hypothetical protein
MNTVNAKKNNSNQKSIYSQNRLRTNPNRRNQFQNLRNSTEKIPKTVVVKRTRTTPTPFDKPIDSATTLDGNVPSKSKLVIRRKFGTASRSGTDVANGGKLISFNKSKNLQIPKCLFFSA